MKNRRLRWMSTLCLALACTGPSAHGIAFAQCGGRPFAFKDAEVNFIVLPYFQSGASSRDLNGLGSQLALLVKLDTLYRSIAFDKWGIVLLAGPEEQCKPETVAFDLLHLGMIHPGGRLIVVWGKLYQQDENVYVQTFARFYRSPEPGQKITAANFYMQIGGSEFEGRLADEFAFPPQRLPIQTMQDIAEGFSKSVFLYEAPDPNSKKTVLPLEQFRKCDRCPGALAFTVEDHQGNWVRVRKESGEVGYLLAQLPEGINLAQHMPELIFLQGLMGFGRYGQQKDMGPAGTTDVADQALLNYARQELSAEEPETRAAALELSGILEFLRGEKEASERFDQAYDLVPYSSDARNLAAAFRVHRDYNLPGKKLRPQEVVSDFVAAAALDPSNSIVLQNLESFYNLLAAAAVQQKIDPEFAIRPGEIRAQLAKVRAIRQNLAKSAPAE
jgi:hypothetical protein